MRALRASRKFTTGFTLIELLVVIAIIGMLASIVLASLNTARAKSRDARRLEDLKQLQLALEMYYNDNNAYPSTASAWWGNCSGFGSHGQSGASGWVPNLAPTYISTLPLDPKPIDGTGCYIYNSNGTDYKLLAYGTAEHTVASTESFYDAQRPGSTLQISTPGAVAW